MREPHRAAPALSCLAPDIVGVILEGRANQALMLERLERPLPLRELGLERTSRPRWQCDPEPHAPDALLSKYPRCGTAYRFQ
jgi:hypothetical protein